MTKRVHLKPSSLGHAGHLTASAKQESTLMTKTYAPSVESPPATISTNTGPVNTWHKMNMMTYVKHNNTCTEHRRNLSPILPYGYVASFRPPCSSTSLSHHPSPPLKSGYLTHLDLPLVCGHLEPMVLMPQGGHFRPYLKSEDADNSELLP